MNSPKAASKKVALLPSRRSSRSKATVDPEIVVSVFLQDIAHQILHIENEISLEPVEISFFSDWSWRWICFHRRNNKRPWMRSRPIRAGRRIPRELMQLVQPHPLMRLVRVRWAAREPHSLDCTAITWSFAASMRKHLPWTLNGLCAGTGKALDEDEDDFDGGAQNSDEGEFDENASQGPKQVCHLSCWFVFVSWMGFYFSVFVAKWYLNLSSTCMYSSKETPELMMCWTQAHRRTLISVSLAVTQELSILKLKCCSHAVLENWAVFGILQARCPHMSATAFTSIGGFFRLLEISWVASTSFMRNKSTPTAYCQSWLTR